MDAIISREAIDCSRILGALGIKSASLAPVLSNRGFNIVSNRRFQGAVSASDVQPLKRERLRAAAKVHEAGQTMDSGVFFFDGSDMLFAEAKDFADS